VQRPRQHQDAVRSACCGCAVLVVRLERSPSSQLQDLDRTLRRETAESGPLRSAAAGQWRHHSARWLSFNICDRSLPPSRHTACCVHSNRGIPCQSRSRQPSWRPGAWPPPSADPRTRSRLQNRLRSTARVGSRCDGRRRGTPHVAEGSWRTGNVLVHVGNCGLHLVLRARIYKIKIAIAGALTRIPHHTMGSQRHNYLPCNCNDRRCAGTRRCHTATQMVKPTRGPVEATTQASDADDVPGYTLKQQEEPARRINDAAMFAVQRSLDLGAYMVADG
jgi:hypothetical protein